MRKAYVKISKKQSSTEFIRGLARGDLYALVWDIIRTDSWRRRRNVSIPWWDKNLLMWWNTMVVRFVGSCEINPAPMNVNKNSRFIRLQIPPHSAPRTYWVTDWLSDCRELRATSYPAWVHTRSHCVERQWARSLVCFRGWSSWGMPWPIIVRESPPYYRANSTRRFSSILSRAVSRCVLLGFLVFVSMLFFDFLVCIDAQCSFFLIYMWTISLVLKVRYKNFVNFSSV